jgi:hypothetical protein
MFCNRRTFLGMVFALAVAGVTIAGAQSPEPPLGEERLTVHSLVREDIFAGFLAGDMERLARGEKNIRLLLEKRPADRASLLAWQGGAALFRAVQAREKERHEEFEEGYRKALELFSEAERLAPGSLGVVATTGGSFLLFADRLPENQRAPAWERAYQAYRELWKQQEPVVAQLPQHFRGELLGGLVLSAQRTGRRGEMAQYLDRMLTVLRDTPYETAARQWKSGKMVDTRITCLGCHDAGRLANRLEALK